MEKIMSKYVRNLAAALILTLSCSAALAADSPPVQSGGHPDAAIQADRAAVNTNCAHDAKIAGCGADQVGTGLMKCIHAYKEKTTGWNPSEACHNAMTKLMSDKANGK
jgi:hypothetical protein